jgi:hypothetical protein
MRWTVLLPVVVIAVSLLSACDDKKDETTATQKATPDNTPELTCRMIKECNDELQRRAEAKHKTLWEGVGETEVQLPDISVNKNGGENASESGQAEESAQ